MDILGSIYKIYNATKEYTLQLYPNAIIIYNKFEELKIEYNQRGETV